MGAGSSVAGALPPLPPGATLTSSGGGAASGGLPPLPPGATLNTPAPTMTEESFMAAHPALKIFSDIIDSPIQASIGAAKSAVSGVGGLLHMLGQYGVVPLTDQSQSNPGPEVEALKDAGTYLQQHFQQHGVAQHVGGAAELIGELLSPLGIEEAPTEGGRAISFADRLAQQGKIAKFLTDHPKLATLAAVGARATHAALKTAAQTGAQTFVHTGGDAAAAGRAAEVGGATAGVASPIADLISSVLARNAPAVENIAGEEVPTLSTQRPEPSGSVTTKEVPKVAKAQQAAAPRVFKNIAQRATQQALNEANQGRAIPGLITDEARLLAPPEEMQPYTFRIQGGTPAEGTEGEIAQPAAKAPQAAFKPPKYTTSSAPQPTVEGVEGSTGEDLATSTPREPQRDVAAGPGDITATDVETAQMHLSRLNDIVDNPPPGMKPAQLRSIEAARDDLQEQMDVYHSYQRTLPNFSPVDADRAAASVGNFGEAADQLQNAAKPIYQKLDEETANQFSKLNKYRAAALKVGQVAQADAYETRIDSLIAESKSVTPAERQQATQLWAKSKILDRIHFAIEHAANVSERYQGQVAGGRVLSGTRLQNGLQAVLDKYGTDRVEGVIGREGVENITRMANLLKLPPQEQNAMRGISMSIFHNLAHGKIGGAAGAILGHHLGGFEGALAGSYAGAQAERMVLRAIATSPAAGKLFEYAVRNNVTPRIAAGLISAELVREHQQEEQQQGESKQ